MNVIQGMEFEILKTFKKFCQNKKINFFLVGGTLLGAVRHKGFIPWDDDIDVGMLREEYNKLIDIAKKNPYIDNQKRYKILIPLEENHIYPYIKIIDTTTLTYEKYIKKEFATGLWIDVFPFDYGADTLKEIKELSRKHSFYKLFFKFGVSGELPLNKKILKLIAAPFYKILTRGDYTYWVKKILRLPVVYKTNFIGGVVWLNQGRDMFPAEWILKTKKLTFENEEFDVPAGYKNYLTQFYGDYMKLPAEKDRVIHDFEWEYVNKKR